MAAIPSSVNDPYVSKSTTMLPISAWEAITVPGTLIIAQMIIDPAKSISSLYLVLSGIALLSAPIGKAICGTGGCNFLPSFLATLFADVQGYEKDINISTHARANILMIASGLIYPMALGNYGANALLTAAFWSGNIVYIISGVGLGALGGYVARQLYYSTVNRN